jgi:hypothetical protein
MRRPDFIIFATSATAWPLGVDVQQPSRKVWRIGVLEQIVPVVNGTNLGALRTPVVVAAKKATETIPIVMAATGGPLATGVITGLARPSANVTRLSALTAISYPTVPGFW